MIKFCLPLALLLATVACSDPDQAELSDNEFNNMVDGTYAIAPENPEAAAVSVAQKDDLIDFSFSYSAEAAAIPLLKADLDDKMDKARSELRRMAEDEAEFRKEEGLAFNGLYSKSTYTTMGSSRRLLSLLGEIATYTGGAHGNRGTVAILWDRVMEKPVDAAVLFGNADTRDQLLHSDWCDALNALRRERVGELAEDGVFTDCPDLDSITIAPVDTDEDGKFDTLQLIADPYVAGSYAEGDYRVELDVTPTIVSGIAEPYRGAFGQ